MNLDKQDTPYASFERSTAPPPPEKPRRTPVKTPSVTPYVTYALLGFTMAVFLAQQVSQLLFGGDIPATLGLKVNGLIAQGQYWRLFTPMFLHGSLLHIGFNMYALYILGPGLERHFGNWRFLLLYLLSGFAGNVASFMFSEVPSLGSSTAIFGLLGAEGVFLYANRLVLGGVARRALNNIVFVALINLLIGLSPGIDNWGHLGGLVGGTLFAWLGGPILSVEGLFPDLSLVDKRELREVVLAGLGVGALFLFLTAATLYINFR